MKKWPCFLAVIAGSSLFAGEMTPPPKKWGEDNIPKNGRGPFIMIDALVWKGDQNGSEFAVTNSSTTDVQVYLGQESSPNFKYQGGARVGLGYNIKDHDYWNLFACWTYFRNTAHKTLTSDGSDLFQPIFTIDYGGSYYASVASSRWHLNLNMIDLELRKHFYVSDYFTLQGFTGLRNAWIYQADHVTYSGDQLSLNSVSPTNVVFKNNFWGLGFIAGVETLWGIGKGFSLYANGSTALLAGRFILKTSETTPTSLNNQVGDRFNTIKPVTDLGMGFRWDKTFSCDRFHISLSTGWESLLFANQFQWSAQDTAPFAIGDLAVMGWNFSLGVDF